MHFFCHLYHQVQLKTLDSWVKKITWARNLRIWLGDDFCGFSPAFYIPSLEVHMRGKCLCPVSRWPFSLPFGNPFHFYHPHGPSLNGHWRIRSPQGPDRFQNTGLPSIGRRQVIRVVFRLRESKVFRVQDPGFFVNIISSEAECAPDSFRFGQFCEPVITHKSLPRHFSLSLHCFAPRSHISQVHGDCPETTGRTGRQTPFWTWPLAWVTLFYLCFPGPSSLKSLLNHSSYFKKKKNKIITCQHFQPWKSLNFWTHLLFLYSSACKVANSSLSSSLSV